MSARVVIAGGLIAAAAAVSVLAAGLGRAQDRPSPLVPAGSQGSGAAPAVASSVVQGNRVPAAGSTARSGGPATAAVGVKTRAVAAPDPAPPAPPAVPVREPVVQALLINGGGSAPKSYLSHLHHLQDMVGALRARGIPPEHIHIFSADGQDPGKDLASRAAAPVDFWFVEGTTAGRALGQTELTSTVWDGVTLHPAKVAELRRWFAKMSGTQWPAEVRTPSLSAVQMAAAEPADSAAKAGTSAPNATPQGASGTASALATAPAPGKPAAPTPVTVSANVPLGDSVNPPEEHGAAAAASDHGSAANAAGAGARGSEASADRPTAKVAPIGEAPGPNGAAAATAPGGAAPSTPASSQTDTLQPGDTLLIFVTDHGSTNPDDPDNGLISLWGENLSVFDFRALLAYLRPGVRVVNVMSQCFSGAFADAMAPMNSRIPTGDVCGFYSTTRDRPAYGCYPEGRDKDRIGYAFRFIDAMGRHSSFEDVQSAVMVTDASPDVPLRTSDIYLEWLLQDQASRLKIGFDLLADEQLALAFRDRGRWEPQIRLLDRLGEVYGMFSPRSLAELKTKIDGLQALSKELDVYEDRWNLALSDLRRETLDRFLDQDLVWKDKLDEKSVAALDSAEKRVMLADVISDLRTYAASKNDVWTRLQDLHDKDEDAKSAKYRIDVRLAALLRMRMILIRIAGIQFLNGSPERAAAAVGGEEKLASLLQALDALERCESARIGALNIDHEKPASQEPQDALPPFESDQDAVRNAMPSWLGVRFRPVPDKQRERLGVERGATLIEQVYPSEPAGLAGIVVGDILLGPPGEHFTEPNQIREWTMTSPRDKPIDVDIQRDGETITLAVTLTAYPSKMPALPKPPGEGDKAPSLGSLLMVRPEGASSDAIEQGRHMLVFWATWCAPCKASMPELLAWSEETGVPIVAVSDEDETTVKLFLQSWKKPFPDNVASDQMRASHLDYGVSGTPTFVLVGADGKIEWRQVGYAPKSGLKIPGWTWSGGGQ